jgi:penicillin-binding protein 2
MVKAGSKVGPAFSDYVSKSEVKRRFGGQNAEVSRSLLFRLPLFFLFLAMGIIIARLFYLQIVRGDYYKDLSENNRTRTNIIPAPRGIIYDKNGKALVSNSEVFHINENGQTKIIPRERALKLLSEGEKIQTTIRREYLYKDAFAHVLGYLGQISPEEVIQSDFSGYALTDYVGRTGLEKTYEKILHGRSGRELLEIDVHGKIIRSLGQKEPVSGENLKTTLDLSLQLSIKEAMAEVEKGAVVVSSPSDGSIMALYSKPSFDPNIFTLRHDSGQALRLPSLENVLSDTQNRPLLNRAIAGVYPPGSTFKLVTAVAALSSGAINKNTQIVDTGILRVGEFSFGNWYFLEHGRTDGPVDVIAAMKRSNNIFFYKAAELAGVERMSNFSKNFGLGSRLGIDIEGESAGVVPSPSWKEKTIGEQWYLGDTYNYGIGQGYLLATPLQVNMFTAVFANGGTLYRPHLVKSQKSKVKSQKFIDKEHIELVKEGMRQACEPGGTAWPFFDFKVKNTRLPIDGKNYVEEVSSGSGGARAVRIPVACKTGTSKAGQDIDPHAWITVFAPYYNPEIVVTVLVENGGEGSSTAGPIAKKILQEYFERK